MNNLCVIRKDNMYLENWSKFETYSDKLASTMWTKDKKFACTFNVDAAHKFIRRYELTNCYVEFYQHA